MSEWNIIKLWRKGFRFGLEYRIKHEWRSIELKWKVRKYKSRYKWWIKNRRMEYRYKLTLIRKWKHD